MTPLPESELYANRKVLITGGFGFLGSNLGLALLAGGAKVRILSRSWPPRSGVLTKLSDSVTLFKGDLRDEAVVEDAVRECEVIFNLAARSGSTASDASPFEDLDVNARGQLTLLEACRRVNREAKIVFPSSRLVYRPTTALPVPETAPTGPLSVYGIHKLAGEHYHQLYMHHFGLRTVILRITNPYGPFQRAEQNRYGIINWFIHLALNGRRLPVYGDGKQLRDYVHVDDVSRAFLLAGTSPRTDGLSLNVGSGQPISFRDMAELVIRLANAGVIDWIPWPEDAARVETGSFVADISLIKSTLGWRPTIPLDKGIGDVIEQYRESRSP